jgi:hypothetical protein
MNTAWATSEITLALYFKLPGFGKCRLSGRPRGLEVDMSGMKYGMAIALGTFVCGDPSILFLEF